MLTELKLNFPIEPAPEEDSKPDLGPSRTEARQSSTAPDAAPSPTTADEAGPASQPAPEEVAALAYQFWLERGSPHGSHEEDWHRAEQQLRGSETSSKAAGA